MQDRTRILAFASTSTREDSLAAPHTSYVHAHPPRRQTGHTNSPPLHARTTRREAGQTNLGLTCDLIHVDPARVFVVLQVTHDMLPRKSHRAQL